MAAAGKALTYSPEAARDIAGLPPEAKRKVRAALEALAAGKASDARRLETGGAPEVWRLRVGRWRIAYLPHGRSLRVVRVFPREHGYGWLVDL
jgi:mRNA-degrading endonuclease RelE of RelBE toxin-antitoxin system